jgi:polysaccharide chain length determinant protein (PEP-CTERM system associated)
MISQQILSRTRLERITQEFNLYARERQTMIMEDVIQRMRNDIKIGTTTPRRGREGTSSFTISFDSTSARTAMMVAERLASLFVQENLQDRELLVNATDQFLEAQLENAKRRLIEYEKRLEQFRRDNAGRLPDQVQSNLQMMQNAQLRLQALADSNNRDRDRLATLENTVAEIERVALASAAGSASLSPNDTSLTNPRPGTAALQVAVATANLHALERRLKPQHPDIGRAKRLIAELEAKAAAEAQEPPLVTADTQPVNPAAATRVAQMRTEMETIQRRLEVRRQDDARLKEAIESYAARVEAAPGLESQLTELMRDYSTLQDGYRSLLRKSEESQIAVNLEQRQIGEQFRILDAARLPEKPISPNRVRINVMGLLAGLGLGLAVVALLAYRDTTIATDDDVTTSLPFPVLAVIPVMMTEAELKGSRRRRLMVAMSASLGAVAVTAAVAAWSLGLVPTWVR